MAGQAGSGKDTVSDLLGRKLGLRVIKATMKTLARERGIDVLAFEKKLGSSAACDRTLDALERNQAQGGNCVVVSMLSAHNIPHANLKIWLFASEKERSRRIAKRDGIPASKALAYVRSRDKTTRERWKKVYGVDAWNPLLYDVCINTDKLLPNETVKVVLTYLKNMRG